MNPCARCGRDTGSDAMTWCCEDCQTTHYQAAWAVERATVQTREAV